jgi:hypothetical protein
MLIEDLQLLLNRRMRTRMYGGVGAAASNGGGYPISATFTLMLRSPTRCRLSPLRRRRKGQHHQTD